MILRIRQAGPGEEPVIENIIRQSMLASYAHFLPKDVFRHILDLDRPGVVARENGPNFVIAEADCAPAGVMLLKGNYVDHLWIHPDAMGKGVGSALLLHAETLAAEAGHDRLTLDCLERNEPGLGFYRARGFTAERTYTATIEHLAGERVCFMAKPLDPDPEATR